MVTEVVQTMHGFGQTSDRVAILSAAIGQGDLSFQVDTTQGSAVGISPGIVEIDGEQILVTAVDAASNTCTVANGGRGWNSTTATAHSQYSRITSKPRFPRSAILNQMNEVLNGLYPDLFGVATFNTTATYPQYTYVIPGVRPLRILTAEWQDPLQQWHPIRAIQCSPVDGSIRVGSGPMVGRPLRILYAVEPQPFTSESDDFVTQTLLPLSTSDCVILGTMAKLAITFDISRAQINSVEQQSRGSVVPPNTGMNLNSALTRSFKDRLANESKSLRALYPAQIRKTV